MARVLFVDTETNGKPLRYTSGLLDPEAWPRLVQVAWCLADGPEFESVILSEIIRPDGWEIPPEVTAIHGISTERAARDGQPLFDVLHVLKDYFFEADLVVAHNSEFDSNVIFAETTRLPDQDYEEVRTKDWYCTMRETTHLCRLPGGRRGYKWPTLGELHNFLFGRPSDSVAHTADGDVRTLVACYRELSRRGLVA